MNRKIVITGASSDIGLAICRRLIRKSDRAILQYCKNEDKLKGIINRFGDGCSSYRADFSHMEEIRKFTEILPDTDILINCAAQTITDLLVNIEEHAFIDMIRVNIIALVELCRVVIPGMIINRKGIIVNISSVAAGRGNRGQSVYAGTKGFIEAFTRCLAAEYGSKGIRVNCVAPGAVGTGSISGLLSYAKNEVINASSLKRLGRAAEIADVVSFLCSEKASYINGQVIAADGGFMLGV